MKMIRIEDDQYYKLQYTAKKEDMSMTKYMAKLLSEALDGTIEKKISSVPQGTYIQEYPSTPADVLTMAGTPIAPKEVDAFPPLTNTIPSILGRIEFLKAERDEKLANCQDRASSLQIRRDYEPAIQLLWDEYQEVKAKG